MHLTVTLSVGLFHVISDHNLLASLGLSNKSLC